MLQQYFSGHRFKRTRLLLLLSLTLIGVFYYSFLNESHELNQHLDEDELPHVTGDDGTQLTKEQLDSIELSDWATILEKNKYFPLVNGVKGEVLGTKVGFRLPEEYFNDQKKITVRKWKRKEHYPVGRENYRKFPRVGKPSGYSQIQTREFGDGGKRDQEKLDRIKGAFQKSWKIYKDHAYGHDEVTPFSHKAMDAFNGWSSTLVDSLDTLWLMGLSDELKEGISFIKEKVNFKQSFRDVIPIFENTIRILGGLLSAYEVTGDKALLVACQELGDLLMESFDTPNRMPQMFYSWTSEAQNRMASKLTHLSEIGTLSLEFSRLSQLTGDHKYYDAIDRITQMFKRSRDKFIIKGLYGNIIDASGCRFLTASEIKQGVHLKNKKVQKVIDKDRYAYCEMVDYVKNFVPQEDYSLGGLGDSFYEYLPKMYHLLRGHATHATVYKEMYLDALAQIKRFMLFTPKIPGGEITLFVTGISATETKDVIEMTPRDEMQHLACFVGGMIGLGSRLFNTPEDMDVAKKVTLGCVNLYAQMGIMPEQVECDRADDGEKYDESLRMAQLLGDDLPKEPRKSLEDRLKEGEIPPMEELTEEERKRLKAMVADATTPQAAAPAPQKRDVVKHVTVVEKGKPINYNVIKRTHFTPFTMGADGVRRWQVGITYDQPIYLNDMHPTYLLRPEAIESVWYMYRLTGDPQWRIYGWNMWQQIERLAQKDGVFAAVADITRPLDSPQRYDDAMESFWFSETLKYFYLLFEDVSVFSLDEWVFNTEAHPFKLVD